MHFWRGQLWNSKNRKTFSFSSFSAERPFQASQRSCPSSFATPQMHLLQGSCSLCLWIASCCRIWVRSDTTSKVPKTSALHPIIIIIIMHCNKAPRSCSPAPAGGTLKMIWYTCVITEAGNCFVEHWAFIHSIKHGHQPVFLITDNNPTGMCHIVPPHISLYRNAWRDGDVYGGESCQLTEHEFCVCTAVIMVKKKRVEKTHII